MPAVALKASVNLNVHSVNAALAFAIHRHALRVVRSAGIAERHQQPVERIFVEIESPNTPSRRSESTSDLQLLAELVALAGVVGMQDQQRRVVRVTGAGPSSCRSEVMDLSAHTSLMSQSRDQRHAAVLERARGGVGAAVGERRRAPARRFRSEGRRADRRAAAAGTGRGYSGSRRRCWPRRRKLPLRSWRETRRANRFRLPSCSRRAAWQRKLSDGFQRSATWPVSMSSSPRSSPSDTRVT